MFNKNAVRFVQIGKKNYNAQFVDVWDVRLNNQVGATGGAICAPVDKAVAGPGLLDTERRN